MKKIVLLIGFLFIGMISFANAISASSKVESGSIAIALTNNSTENDKNTYLYQFGDNQNNLVVENVKVTYTAGSCTLWANVTIGFGSSAVTVGVSATGDSCAEAAALLNQQLELMGQE